MRIFGFALAAAAATSWCVPVSAAIMVTTAKSVTCGTDCVYDDNTSLKPFDGSLGTLTGITLGVSVLSTTDYFPVLIDDQTAGSAELAFQSPFNAFVNGLTYSFPIAGQKTISGTVNEIAHTATFNATGSATFTLDPALFAAFVGTYDQCDTDFSPGICATGSTTILPNIPNITSSRQNLQIYSGAGTYIVQYIDWSLTYTYTPFGAVPEPATWAMMLLGFGLVGWRMRRGRASAMRLLAA